MNMLKPAMFVLMFVTSFIMLAGVTPLVNIHLLSNAMAQENGYDYDSYSSNKNENPYSTYPTYDKSFSCQTGQFEGFFVEAEEFCNLEITQGQRGQQGQQGIQGPKGDKGEQGLPGINGKDGVSELNSDPCNDCLLFGLFELDSGRIILDANITLPIVGETSISLALDNSTIELLMEQLKVEFNLPDNANIFDICSAIDASIDAGTIETEINGLSTAIGTQLTSLTNEKITEEIIIFLTLLGLSEEEIQIALPAILLESNLTDVISDINGNIGFVLESIIDCIISNQ